MFQTDPLQPGDALLIVDVQEDFLAGDALPVPDGDAVVPVLNRYLDDFAARNLPVFASRDWHPRDHVSFRGRGGPWPRHCVMQTDGAHFARRLRLPETALVFSKGWHPDEESYSAFACAGLEDTLRSARVARLFVGGLATDYCILHTVRDALDRGFRVFLLEDAIRAVNVAPDDGPRALQEMRRLGAVGLTQGARVEPDGLDRSALLTDLYQLTMARAYFTSGMDRIAVFELFVRRLPPNWNFLVAAGLEQVLDFLGEFHFNPGELAWLVESGEFDRDFVRQLREIRFCGDVDAMPEGTVFFPDEPILRVTAPIAQAQLVESRLLNLLHFQTLIASKAVRSVLAAPGRTLVDFGLRRAHGAEAGLLASRACWLAGFSATSNVQAGRRFGIPLSGTMAHSFIEACDSEEEAFIRFADSFPRDVVVVLDTYDCLAAAATLVRVAPRLRAAGVTIQGVRLDSGDLPALARGVREVLDAGGLEAVRIFASGNLDEQSLVRLAAPGVPIDGFGLGTRVVTSADAPYLDCAYKLQSYAGRARCKHSEGKATWPGAKQVWRRVDHSGEIAEDEIALADEACAGEALLEPVMRAGRRIAPRPALAAIRERVREQLATLPPRLLAPAPAAPLPVRRSRGLRALALELGVPGAGIADVPVHDSGSTAAVACAAAPGTETRPNRPPGTRGGRRRPVARRS